MSGRLVVIALTVGAVLGLPSRVADAQEIIGVLHLEVDGVSSAAADKFEQSIEEGLVGGGFSVAPRKRLHALLGPSSYAPGCRVGPCLKEVYRNTKVRLVLVGAITGLGPSYRFVVTLLNTETGRVTSQVSDECNVCTLQEAITSATLAVMALVNGVGGATVPDPLVGPLGSGKHPDLLRALTRQRERTTYAKRTIRRTGLFFLSAGVLAAGAGLFLVNRHSDKNGYASFAAAGTLGLSGVTLFLISRRF